MWKSDRRSEIWEQLSRPWDVIVIGGGVTGAGILRQATRRGLRALLVEQRDFAWGTSSRSSKLVHGGLRYLRQGQVGLTRASVNERERLLQQAPGLVTPLDFLWVTYEGDRPGRWLFQMGLIIYDLLAGRLQRHFRDPAAVAQMAPHLKQEGLVGGFKYSDAQTDDARLVLRLIQEAVAGGGTAVNYTQAEALLPKAGSNESQVRGVRLRDVLGKRTTDVYARVVINATGAWADRLRGQVDGRRNPQHIRPLRGSHLVFPERRLPVGQAISFAHPLDRRPVSIVPWQGVTLVGTTDEDHGQGLDREPRISGKEVAYLMAAVEPYFPSLAIGLEDVISTFAGVRAVVDTGKADPSRESRDHVLWEEGGLLTVTGGKLTTFRLIARDALEAARAHLPAGGGSGSESVTGKGPLSGEATEGDLMAAIEREIPGAPEMDEATARHLWGRYGALAPEIVRAARPQELEPIPGSRCLWADVRWAARAESVVHLEDVLLRRTRLGILLPEGGEAWLPAIAEICQCELGWDDRRRKKEVTRYRALWRRCYSLPERETIPDWHTL